MFNAIGVIAVLFLLFFPMFADARQLAVIRKDHPLDTYTIDLLKLVLKHTGKPYTLDVTPAELTQQRMIEQVLDGTTDVYWMASSAEVEEQLLPVRFPLLKGLLGYRICIIHRDSQAKFDEATSEEEVKALRYGQGIAWPDTQILKHNGFKVVTANLYLSLFHMLDGGRFDAFPRGLLEPWTEVPALPELNLAVEKKLLFIYRMPFYFFVNPEDKELALDIRRGLEKMLENGEFDKFYFNNELIKTALELSDLKNRRVFYLDNPLLTPETPLDRKDYWLDIDKI